MSKTVWKFRLDVADEQYVDMPANSHILCVQVQPFVGGEDVCLWALVDPKLENERRKILIAGTGHNREDLGGLLQYIGTFQLARGKLVFHVFESVLDAELADSEKLVAAEIASVA